MPYQPEVSTRSAQGRMDPLIIVLAVVAIAVAIIFVLLFLNIVSQSENHVQKIRKTNVAYSEAMQWRAETAAVDKQIEADLRRHPMRVQASYDRLEMSARGMEYISKMRNLKELTLAESTVEDEHLKYLERLPLTYLSLFGTRISDQGLSSLAKIKTLEVLSLGATEVTDAGLERLEGLEKLRKLDLSATAVTDDGISAIPPFPGLTKLMLCDTHVSGAGLRNLSRLPRLVSLDVAGVKVTPATMQAISALTNLEEVILLRSELDDTSLQSFKNTQIRMMDLSKNPLTDAGIRHLKTFHGLTELKILECPNISPAAVSEINKALPKCNISYSKDHIQPLPFKIN